MGNFRKEETMASRLERYENRNREGRAYPASPFHLFEDFFNDWAFKNLEDRSAEGWTPSADIYEKDGDIKLMISLPGMSEKEIDIKVEGQILTVSGERKSPESEGCTYHRKESRFGSFARSFSLPDSADPNNITADYKNGILAITIPQKPEVKPRTIKVNI